MAYSRLFSEAALGFPSFANLKEDECLEQKQQWFCKQEKYGIIYVGSLNLSRLSKNILPPSDCINRAEEVEWEFTETVKVCNDCLRVIYPLEVLDRVSRHSLQYFSHENESINKEIFGEKCINCEADIVELKKIKHCEECLVIYNVRRMENKLGVVTLVDL